MPYFNSSALPASLPAQRRIMVSVASGWNCVQKLRRRLHACGPTRLLANSSAPGGTTRIKNDFGDPLNEGFTEMFTKQFCAELGVADAPAYPNEVAFVTKLAAAVSYGAVFQAYMKNAGMDEILKTLSARWASRSEAFGKAFSTKRYVPPAEPEQRHALLVERLKDGLFLTTHKLFWDALLRPG